MFYDKFIILCKKNGLTTSRAATANNISRTSVTRWKNGALPNAEIIKKLSNYFGVSTDYFLEMESASENQEKEKISLQDEKMINIILQMSEESKKKIWDYVELLELRESKNNNSKLI